MLEESILKLSSQLSTINRNQKYFRTRENRNFSTVRSTERRIFNFSIIESCMMITMAGLQVFIVRFFFQGARKGESRHIRNMRLLAREYSWLILGRIRVNDVMKAIWRRWRAEALEDCIISTMQVHIVFGIIGSGLESCFLLRLGRFSQCEINKIIALQHPGDLPGSSWLSPAGS